MFSGINPGIRRIIANSRPISEMQCKIMALQLERKRKREPVSIMMQGAKMLHKAPQIVRKGSRSKDLKLRAQDTKKNNAMKGRDKNLA